MLIRSNPGYTTRFEYDRRRGLLLITKGFIFATKSRAWGWA
jgi:hypothetical protein